MKNIYFAIAILFVGFTSCKNTENTDVENSNDSIAVQQNRVEEENTTSMDTTSVEADSSDVALPNEMSTSTSTSSNDPSKGKFPLAETKWELVELNGKPINKTTSKDYFINFDSKSGTFKAFAGCNRISGSYFMKASNKLGFSNIVTTRMACANMDVERGFYNNLQKTDNYMIEGKKLHLHIGKKAAAKFEAIR